jgi:co-chaperonin GroES (HSP10)
MNLNIYDLAKRPANVGFKEAAMAALGDLSGYTVLASNVLVASYIKPGKTAGGLILPDSSTDEDRWQGKIGLVLKLGETAFKYDGMAAYEGTVPQVGDYVMFHTSDSRELGINGTSCRFVDSSLIRMIVPDPDGVY